ITDGRAGTWANFINVEGKCAARMSLAGSLFAKADSLQWAALRHVIHQTVAVVGARPENPARLPDPQISAGAALEVLDAHIAWCQAGNSSTSRHAPARSLTGRRITVLASFTR